jgi:hypothetical protein
VPAPGAGSSSGCARDSANALTELRYDAAMMTRGLVLIGMAAALAGAGCDADASCEKAVDNAMTVFAKSNQDDGDKSAGEDAQRRKEALKKCKDDKWSVALRNCVAKAKNMGDIETCASKDTGGQEKYVRKSKTTEASMNVKKIYDGARAYYLDEYLAPGATVPPAKQFPASAPTTPPLGDCCAQPGHKCAPNPALWSGSWQDLKFSMDDPHYYSYTFEASGSGATAEFTARANGDLDCDGDYSTFELVGKVDADGNVTGSAGFFKSQELE